MVSLGCAGAHSSGPWRLPGGRRRRSAQLLVLYHGFRFSKLLTRVADGCPAEGRSVQRRGPLSCSADHHMAQTQPRGSCQDLTAWPGCLLGWSHGRDEVNVTRSAH